jgi:hypothetical protein
MAEFWRALRTLKALQAERALQAEQAREAGQGIETSPALAAHPLRPAARPPILDRSQPNEPERIAERRLACLLPEAPAPRHALPDAAAPWLPNEPEARQHGSSSAAPQTDAGRYAKPSRPKGANARVLGLAGPNELDAGADRG